MCAASYSFWQIILKLYKCFGHSLKMCICSPCYPQIILLLFSQVEFSRFLGINYYHLTRSDTGYLVLPFYADSFEILHVLLSWSQFLYNPHIILCHVFLDVNLSIQYYQCLYIGDTFVRNCSYSFRSFFLLMSWPENMNLLSINSQIFFLFCLLILLVS